MTRSLESLVVTQEVNPDHKPPKLYGIKGGLKGLLDNVDKPFQINAIRRPVPVRSKPDPADKKIRESLAAAESNADIAADQDKRSVFHVSM